MEPAVSVTSRDFVDYNVDVFNPSRNTVDASTPLLNQPRKHPESQVGATRTLMNFLKGMIGPGCLSLPFAFKQCGLWTGLVLVFLIGFLNSHCMQVLVECAHYLCDKTNKLELDYGHLAKKAFDHGPDNWKPHSKKAMYFINLVLILLQFGICAVAFVFMAAHMQELFEVYTPDLYSTNIRLYLAILLIPVILINFIRTLKVIAICSSIGNFLMLIAFVIVFVSLALQSFRENSRTLPYITDFPSICLGIGSILYAFEGQAMILPLENKMKRPWRMLGSSGVLWTAMTVVTCVYVTTGFFGYASYRDAVRGSITLNFPNIWYFTVAKILLIAVVYLGFPLQLYIIIGMLWPAIKRKLPESFSDGLVLFLDYLFRFCLVAITFLMAVVIPQLEKIIPLVGVSAGMVVAFIFPPLLDCVTFWRQMNNQELHSRSRFKTWAAKNILLAIFGVFGLVAGLYANIINLM